MSQSGDSAGAGTNVDPTRARVPAGSGGAWRPRSGGFGCPASGGLGGTDSDGARVSGGGRQRQCGSRPVSRVLSRAVIHLWRLSPDAYSDLPGSSCGHTQRFPIRSCSRWGLPCRSVLPRARCALTAPFHPYRTNPAVSFLLHWPWAHAPQALPGTLPSGARTFLRDCSRRLLGRLPPRQLIDSGRVRKCPRPGVPDQGRPLRIRASARRPRCASGR